MSKILTNTDGSIRLELRDDRLSAWMIISEHSKLTNEQEILELIDLAGIKNGFEEAMKYMRKHRLEKEYNTSFPVAICNYVQGETKLNYYFDLDQAKQFDGNIRIDVLSELTCLEAGSVVADYNSNIFDRQGSIYDIYGEMIKDEGFDLDSANQLIGANITFNREMHQFVAECTGFPSVSVDGKISIIDKLNLQGDIDNPERPVRSTVSLVIDGNIANTVIKSAGHLTITGALRNCVVFCQGDLTVGGDILDSRQPGLEVWGSVLCAGISNSRVITRGQIQFAHSVTNSELFADGGIVAETGVISGAHVECSSDIIVQRLGDLSGSITEIEITISPFNKALLMQMTKDIIHLKQDTVYNTSAIEELNVKIKNCEGELDEELNTYLRLSHSSKIKLLVHEDVYPPVQIRVLKHEYTIKTHQHHLEIIEKD